MGVVVQERGRRGKERKNNDRGSMWPTKPKVFAGSGPLHKNLVDT